MKTHQVIRTHRSPYHHSDFEKNERDRLEQLSGIHFVSLEKAELERPSILITNTHTQLKDLPKRLLESTELILHSNSGYDHFAEEEELWRQIPLVIGHKIRAQAVAEYSLACVFEGLSELPQHLSWDKNRHWDRPLIKNQQVLVFGYGHIGKIVAGTLCALGAEVTLIDPFNQDIPFKHYRHWQEAEVGKFRTVILCCSLNSTSRHLLNDDFFQKAHPELILINGARGKLIHEEALRGFLLSHPEAMAFLDVFEKEPFDENWHHFPQVWKTSHIAGVHKELDRDIIEFEYETLSDFLSLGRKDFQQKYRPELLQNKWIKGELI